MENCNRHNSGTVTSIHLKLGTRIDLPSGIMDMTPRSRDKRSRSQGNVTYSVKNGNNSVLGDRINFTFEPAYNYLGTNCLPCQRRLPSNVNKKYGLYDHIGLF